MLMIRLFSVLCKLNDIKFSDKKWFENAVGASFAPDQSFPFCSAKGCLRLFGHYDRYLVEWDGRAQRSNTVTVPRYICDSCGHTHAMLPSCIIPYKSYSLRFLLIVLRSYFTRSCSVVQICDYYGITISMLYRWLHLFQRQKALWLGVLGNMSALEVPFLASLDGVFLKDFFLKYRFSYLQSPYVIDSEMLSQQQHHPDSIT